MCRWLQCRDVYRYRVAAVHYRTHQMFVSGLVWIDVVEVEVEVEIVFGLLCHGVVLW